MANSPYGLTALLETMNHIDMEEDNLNAIAEAMIPSMETGSILDDDVAKISGVDVSGEETGFEDFLDDADAEDPEIEKMLSKIDPEDDEASVDDVIESYIQENYY